MQLRKAGQNREFSFHFVLHYGVLGHAVTLFAGVFKQHSHVRNASLLMEARILVSQQSVIARKSHYDHFSNSPPIKCSGGELAAPSHAHCVISLAFEVLIFEVTLKDKREEYLCELDMAEHTTFVGTTQALCLICC